MFINKVLKRQTIIITVTIIGICLTLIGISYALLSSIKESQTQIVETGDLVIQFTNDKLLEDELVPIPDSEVQDMKGYNFSVTNKGSLPMRYKIYIYDKEGIEESLKTKMLSHEYIKVQLDNYPIKKLSELTNEEGKLLLQDNLDVKMKGITGDVKTHTIKVWVDEEAPEEIVGNIIALDIEVKGEVGEIVNTKAFNEIIIADNKGIFSDEAGNIRYAGAEPNNYIWFNCDNYYEITQANAETVKHCEKWRIIGLMNNMITINEETNEPNEPKEKLVKIIRADNIGDIAWDSKGSYGSNDWTKATLQQTLNSNATSSGYLNSSYNQNGVKGITANTNKMIETVVWNLGGIDYPSGTTQEFYNAERGEEVYEGRAATWPGKIALLYVSDYGYATSGSDKVDGKDRTACLEKEIDNWWDGEFNTDCALNDWLKPSSNYLYALTPDSSDFAVVSLINSSGGVFGVNAIVKYGVRPSLYLKSSVKILDDGESDGSKNKPYILIDYNLKA